MRVRAKSLRHVARTRASCSNLPLRDDLRGIDPYMVSRPDVRTRLNTNENPYPLPPALTDGLHAAVAQVIGGLNRYPSDDAEELRRDLAGYLSCRTGVAWLTAENIWPSSGSNEAMLHVLQCFGGPGRIALGFTPTYAMYQQISRVTGTCWVNESREADFSIDLVRAVKAIKRHEPDVVFLASPNNPCGTPASLELIRAVLDATSGMVIVDEAYAEFLPPGTCSALQLLSGAPRLIVVRTLSKAFAMAAARVGYLAADRAVVEAMQLVRLPYHISAFSRAAARFALAHADEILASVDAIRTQRDRIVRELTAMGLTVVPSEANYVLFGGLSNAEAAWRRLVDHGVLVRDVGMPGMLRVTIGTPDETSAFLDSLRKSL